MFDPDVQAPTRIGPLAARPVRINLDAVAFRVVVVQGLADEVVGSPSQRQPLLARPAHESTQLILRWEQDREVIQAGRVSRAAAQPRRGFQPKQSLSVRPESGRALVSGQLCKAERLVKAGLTFEVEHLQLNRAERPRGTHAEGNSLLDCR